MYAYSDTGAINCYVNTVCKVKHDQVILMTVIVTYANRDILDPSSVTHCCRCCFPAYHGKEEAMSESFISDSYSDCNLSRICLQASDSTTNVSDSP